MASPNGQTFTSSKLSSRCMNGRRCSVFVVVVVFLMLSVITSTAQSQSTVSSVNQNQTGRVKEYCELDTFSAQCSDPDEVISVRMAHFGRMRLGRCLTVNNGNLGCQLDVLPQLESLCSGRRRCDVPVSAVNHAALACTREVRGYLEASYVCVKVVMGQKKDCERRPPVPAEVLATSVSTRTGYLASVVTEETGCGSMDAPWSIRALPGQTIRLRLLDFAASSRQPKDQGMPYVCQVYAVIKEKSTSRAGETICASDLRESHVYTSLTNVIEIRILAARKDGKAEPFMFKYEVTGCPDMTSTNDGLNFHWMRRNGDVTLFGCNSSVVTWQLKCEGDQWTGNQLTCSSLPPAEHMTVSNSSIWGAFSTSQWAAIIVIMIIAVTLGMIIFFVGLVYLKRRRSNHYGRPCSPGQSPGTCISSQHCSGAAQVDYHLALSADGHHTATLLGSPSKSAMTVGTLPITGTADPLQAENDYFRTWQLQRPVPGSAVMMTSSSAGNSVRGAGGSSRPFPGSLRFAERGRSIPEHVYESPKLDRRDFPVMSQHGECNCCCVSGPGCEQTCANGNTGGSCGDVMCNCGQPPMPPYFDIDQNGRPVHV